MSELPLLSPSDVLKQGLKLLKIEPSSKSNAKSKGFDIFLFHFHYVSDPIDIANIWYDLLNTSVPDAMLLTDERGYKGFKMYTMTHYYLWNYPRNSHSFTSRFNTYERICQGEPLWKWIRKMAALKAVKITWDDDLNSHNTFLYTIAVDGTDFKCHEPKHPLFNINKR